MSSSLDFPCQFEGARDIMILASFVAAAKQYNHRFASTDEIQPVSGSIVDPHL
jgi:hypothetical protein